MNITIEKIDENTFELQFDNSGTGQFQTELGAKQAANRQFGFRMGRMKWIALPNGKIKAERSGRQ